MKIKIADIRTDGDTQSRYLKLNGTTVYEYADDMQAGRHFARPGFAYVLAG